MHHDQVAQLVGVERSGMTCLQIDLEDRECADDSYRAHYGLGGSEEQGRHREVPVDRLEGHVQPDRQKDRPDAANEPEAKAEAVDDLPNDDTANRQTKAA